MSTLMLGSTHCRWFSKQRWRRGQTLKIRCASSSAPGPGQTSRRGCLRSTSSHSQTHSQKFTHTHSPHHTHKHSAHHTQALLKVKTESARRREDPEDGGDPLMAMLLCLQVLTRINFAPTFRRYKQNENEGEITLMNR